MLFSNKADVYPHLVAYLRETEHMDFFKEFHQRWGGILLASVGIPFLLGLIFHSFIPFWLMSLTTIVCGGLAAMRMQQKKAELFTPELESRLEAHRLFASMRKMLTLHRLHRDLSEPTLTLLNEIARTRQETRQLLEAPYWRQPSLPTTYVQLRDQALTACDQSMNDAVMQFRIMIPMNVEARRPGDYLNEALENFLKVNKNAQHAADVGFDSAFKIADKLQKMRNELEAMTTRGEQDNWIAATEVPGGMLDLTMMEIRTIRQAEEELRQGL